MTKTSKVKAAVAGVVAAAALVAVSAGSVSPASAPMIAPSVAGSLAPALEALAQGVSDAGTQLGRAVQRRAGAVFRRATKGPKKPLSSKGPIAEAQITNQEKGAKGDGQ